MLIAPLAPHAAQASRAPTDKQGSLDAQGWADSMPGIPDPLAVWVPLPCCQPCRCFPGGARRAAAPCTGVPGPRHPGRAAAACQRNSTTGASPGGSLFALASVSVLQECVCVHATVSPVRRRAGRIWGSLPSSGGYSVSHKDKFPFLKSWDSVGTELDGDGSVR